MNPIHKQVEIINKLVSVMFDSAEEGYSSLNCRFDIDIEDESVGQKFSFVKNGKNISALLKDPDWLVMDWVFDLYREMKAHTGGEWTAFTLTVGEDGKATTRFEYSESNNV